MLFLNGLKVITECIESRVPVGRLSMQEGLCRTFVRVEHGQGFPAFRASHAEVDGIVDIRGEVDGLAVFERNFKAATSRAISANGSSGSIGDEIDGDLTKTEFTRITEEFLSVRASASMELSMLLDDVAEAFLFRGDGHDRWWNSLSSGGVEREG